MARVLLLALAACSPSREVPAQRPSPAAAVPSAATAPPAVAAAAAAPDPMSEASLAADLAWLTAPERAGRGSTTAEARATARWIADQLRAAGYAPVEQAIPSAPGQVNVIAELAAGPAGSADLADPATAAAPAVIVVAHYDHLGVIGGQVHPGADDNASGVAVALAVARDLRRRPVSGRRVRVVLLFTGAEEIGLRGARAFVAAPTLPLTQVRAVYNLDMVGRSLSGASADATPELAAVGLPADPDVAEAAREAAGLAALSLLALRPGLLRAFGQAGRSDDWAFRDAGLYAVHFSTGVTDDYHSPRDTPDKVSMPQVARVARFLRALVDRTPP